MAKDKTKTLERAKKTAGTTKGKKLNRGSSSCSKLPAGWIQGDWIQSSLRRDDMDELMESGLVAKGAARLPGSEMAPQPRPEVSAETVAIWLTSITGNKDNPRGARRVVPFSDGNLRDKIYTETYSMPNGEQAPAQDQEGEDSAEESAEWESPDDDDDDDDESEESDEEEEVDSPPRTERRSKQHHDPAGGRGKAVALSTQVHKRARSSTPELTEKTTKHLKTNPIKARKTLPKIKMDVPVASGPASAVTDMDVNTTRDEETDDAASSRADDPPSAAREALRQVTLVMEQVKVIHEASQVAYNASTALEANVKKSCDHGAQISVPNKQQISLNLDLELAQKNLKTAREEVTAMGDVRSENRQLQGRLKNAVSLEKMKQALEQKDLDLAAAQKEVREKTTLADKKLASVGKLEEENSTLKTAVSDANWEIEQLKKDKDRLTDEIGSLKAKKGELEAYLGQLAAKLVSKLEELCQDFEEETGRVETGLDPINCPVRDDVAMNVLRMESRVDSAIAYLARLKAAMTRVDVELWSQVELSQDLESLMDINEDKLAALKVANTKKLTFQSFMDTFLDAATRIADKIDLSSFCDPASSSPAE
nr:nucleolin-like [Aegilops tauschii subsp. strangulata]